MFRKILLASAATVALISPLAATKSEARDFRHEYRHEECYKVYYRARCENHWCYGGDYRNRREAERVAESYRCRGLESYVR